MASVAIVARDGKELDRLDFSDEHLSSAINERLVAQVVRCFLANQRLGTASTKTRGEVRASGRKLYRQKGTGRARAGSPTSPLRRGGSVAFGPKPRDFSLSIPAKMKRQALKACIADKVLSGLVTVVEGLEVPGPKTRDMRKLLEDLSGGRKPLLVVRGEKADMHRAIGNIAGADIADYRNLNTYQILSHGKLFFDKEFEGILVEMFGE